MRRNETRIRRETGAVEVRLVTPREDVLVRVAQTSDHRRIYTSLPVYTNDPARAMSRARADAYQRQALEAVAPELFFGLEYTLERSNIGDWVAISEAAPITERRDARMRMIANEGHYYVWPLDHSGRPLKTEGPFGPYELDTARTTARIRATKGRHDYAVTRGGQFKASNVQRHYRAGTGESL